MVLLARRTVTATTGKITTETSVSCQLKRNMTTTDAAIISPDVTIASRVEVIIPSMRPTSLSTLDMRSPDATAREKADRLAEQVFEQFHTQRCDDALADGDRLVALGDVEQPGPDHCHQTDDHQEPNAGKRRLAGL